MFIIASEQTRELDRLQKYLDKLQNGDYQLVDVVEGVLTDITFNVD